jgi:hypothetical protein
VIVAETRFLGFVSDSAVPWAAVRFESNIPGAAATASDEEPLGTRMNVDVVLRGPDGRVKRRESLHNLIPTVGKEGIVDNLLASPTLGKPTHMAIGTGTEEAKAADTTLDTELDRNALAEKTRSGKVVTMVAEWAAGDGTGAIVEAGLFSAEASGTLFARAVFAVINKGAEDSLTITWTIEAE